MSSADAKAALQACENGIALITAQQKSNQVLINDFNNRQAQWEARKNAYDTDQNNNVKARDDSIAIWDRRHTEWVNALRDQTINAGCGGAGTNPGCPSGFYQTGEHWCNGIGRERECKRTDAELNKQATIGIQNERGPREQRWIRSSFPQVAPAQPQQNQTTINIACCANVSTIVGSSIDATTINQQNDCLKEKKAAVISAEKQESTPTPTPVPTPTPTPTSIPEPTPTPTYMPTTVSYSNISVFINKNKMVIIISIIFVFISSSLVSLLAISRIN